MSQPRVFDLRFSALLCAATLSCATSGAFSATPAASASVNARYEQERAKCMNGSSSEDQATCLKEAAAARDALKKGELNTDDASFRKNEMARCAALTGDDKNDCMARMKGSGTVSGSVAGGGILREKVTVTRGAPVAAMPASAASAR